MSTRKLAERMTAGNKGAPLLIDVRAYRKRHRFVALLRRGQ
jgi:hypothetical protein